MPLGRAREALEGTLLVVDEASLVSMAQMHSLTRIAEAAGIARVALVGRQGAAALGRGRPAVQGAAEGRHGAGP